MNFLKSLTKGKNNKFLGLFLVLVVVILLGVIYNYNQQKLSFNEGISNNMFSSFENGNENEEESSENDEVNESSTTQGNVAPLDETTEGPQYLKVNGLTSGITPGNSCNSEKQMDPKELLPTDANNEWSDIMPNKDLKDINVLSAGHHIGLNTVGSSLRNANLQIRSEPTIPQTNVGPWNNTTIESDNLRRNLDIGSSS